jgi:signal transduction histidine kinase
MPISQAWFRRSNAVFFAVGIAVLLLIVATSLWLTTASERYFAEVTTARAVRSATADLLSLVQDAETGQRGYLLTSDEAYLEPYSAAVAKLPEQRERLQKAAGNLREVEADVLRLSDQLTLKMAELAATVEAKRKGDAEGAIQRVRDGAGKALMDDLRTTTAAILAKSEADLREAVEAQTTASSRLRWTTIIGSILIFAMAALAGWTIASYTRDLIEAQAEVRSLNVDLEDRVRQRTQALTRANEEIQRFAYIVTHDLRAPLVNIMGFTSELEATAVPIKAYVDAGKDATASELEEAQAAVGVDLPEAIGFIRSSTRKMDGLINAILKISREGSRTLRPESINLPTALEAAAAAVHHQASEHGEGIVVDCPALKIRSDRLSLEQVLGNLLDNAIKYRSPSRQLAITMRARRERTGWVTLEIEDNGRGIAEGDHERIFELFRRSGTQDKPGEGIGLAHVRTIVRNLGGDITVRSQLDVGTTFSIILPPDLSAVQGSASS